MQIPEAILSSIQRTGNVVLLTHVHPDGDALGSTLALREILQGMGKQVVVFLEVPVTSLYTFLPGSETVCTDLTEVQRFAREHTGNIITIALDSGDDDRLGKHKEDLLCVCPLLVIDHHRSHKDFGDHRWVDISMSSTGEMIYELALALGAEVNLAAAKNIYVAICSDTGSFRYESTRPRTLRIAADMMELGVRPEEIGNELYDNYTLPRLQLLKEVLGTLELVADDRVAVVCLTNDMLARTGSALHESEGFIDYPRSLRSVVVAIFVKEGINGQIGVSLRSKGDFDVAEIAKGFGGGGHRKAAGCRFFGQSLETVRQQVIDAVRSRLL